MALSSQIITHLYNMDLEAYRMYSRAGRQATMATQQEGASAKFRDRRRATEPAISLAS